MAEKKLQRRQPLSSASPTAGAQARAPEGPAALAREATDEQRRADMPGLHSHILEGLAQGVCVTDERGLIVYTNMAEERMFGYGPAELQGQHERVLLGLTPEEYEGLGLEVTAQLREQGEWVGELANVRKDGTFFITSARVWGVELGGRRLRVCVQEDVTQQKKLDAEIAEFYAGNARLFRQTLMAEQRAVFLANASAVLAKSLAQEEILQRLARLCVPVAADWCAVDVPGADGQVRRVALVHPDAARLARAQSFHARYPLSLEDGFGVGRVLRTGATAFVPELTEALLERALPDAPRRRALLETGLAGFICVALVSRGRILGALTLGADESRRFTNADRRLAEELARRAAVSLDNGLLYQEAQDAIRARDSFLSVASHELNTPLTSLNLNLQALQRTLHQLPAGAPMPEAVPSRLQSAQRQIGRLSKLIRELLDVSRITTGKLKLEYEDVEMAGLVREVVARSLDDISRAGCALHLELPEALGGCWDRLRVEQVVQNLLSNAIKYGRGKPIEVRLEADEARARLSVRDWGIGIPPEGRERLFQRFERLASERNYGGFGLGLWIVKQIVDSMGGTIEVESASGQGSRFTVELPRQRPGSGSG